MNVIGNLTSNARSVSSSAGNVAESAENTQVDSFTSVYFYNTNSTTMSFEIRVSGTTVGIQNRCCHNTISAANVTRNSIGQYTI